MTLNISAFDKFVDWKVLHIYQDGSEGIGKTVLLLRRIVSTGESFAVGKVYTLAHYRSRNDGVINEAVTLAKIPPHPSIIKLYSTQVDEPCSDQVSLILEFCAGEDLRSFSDHALSVHRRIPETFIWHVLYQTLVAMQHLNRYHMFHGDIHGGNLFLRPVEGDAYPDVVLADFEYSNDLLPSECIERYELLALGIMIQFEFFKKKTNNTSDGAAAYSLELRNFVTVLLCGDYTNGLTPLCAETEHDLIPRAKKLAYGDNQTTHRMPEWMIAYFVELRSKAVPRQNNPEVKTAASRSTLGL